MHGDSLSGDAVQFDDELAAVIGFRQDPGQILQAFLQCAAFRLILLKPCLHIFLGLLLRKVQVREFVDSVVCSNASLNVPIADSHDDGRHDGQHQSQQDEAGKCLGARGITCRGWNGEGAAQHEEQVGRSGAMPHPPKEFFTALVGGYLAHLCQDAEMKDEPLVMTRAVETQPLL